MKKFDRVAYASAVASHDDYCVIQYADHLLHNGHTHTHACAQHVWISGPGLIVRIEHHELLGERDAISYVSSSVRP